MADKDTQKVHFTLAKLKEDRKAPPEEFRVGLSGGKIITFPDYYGGDKTAEWTERLLEQLNRREPTAWKALDLWLSKADAEKLRAEKLNFEDLTKLVSAAGAHYENHYGALGEDGGSDD